jgi:hypothetical protein
MPDAPEHESYIFRVIIIIVLSLAGIGLQGHSYNKMAFIQFFPEEIKG